ncbi:hypothetical protein [Flavobacterium sp. H122]|uniref:hypothetical protein n=1 Tax=Flavobacterium sp. H122 TaxID=2529860 RepID=UPI0010A9F80E|nr:hypothetical protein [Flavobacterium sp. H122]
MRTIKMHCKKCNVKLTAEFYEVYKSELRFDDGTNMIEKNKFSVYFNEFTNKKELVIAIDDYYFKNHKDSRRFTGCCGSSGIDGMNKVCANGHEIATEFSDCYMPHYISVNLENVLIKEVSNAYEIKEMKL